MTLRPTHMVFTTGRFCDPDNRHDTTLCGIRTTGRTADDALPLVGSHAAYWPGRVARPDYVLCAACVRALEAETNRPEQLAMETG